MTVMVEAMVTRPLEITSSNPAKVKSSPVISTSSRAVYGARAMSSTSVKMGLA